MKFRINPLFFVLVLALILLGQALNFAWAMVALALHEAAHAAVARLRGFRVKQLVLMPYGAMMSMGESFDPASAALIGFAGPAANGIVALCLTGLWWLYPAVYPITIPFFAANVSLCLFNLLPAYPLDGARILLGLSKNKLRAIKGLQAAGVALSLAFFALFVTSCFFKVNFTFGIIAVFLFYGAAFGSKEEMYISVLDSASKNYALGVVSKSVKISGSAPIARLFHHVSSSAQTEFEIVDDKGETVASLSESRLNELARKFRLSETVQNALSGKGKQNSMPYAHLTARKNRRKNIKNVRAKNKYL